MLFSLPTSSRAPEVEIKSISTCQAESGLMNLQMGDGGEGPLPDRTEIGCDSAGLVFLNQN